MDNKKIIINIGRQFGSGGKATAEEIGRILGIPVYDAELLSEAAKKSGIREEIFSSSDERNRFWAFGTGIGNNEIFKCIQHFRMPDEKMNRWRFVFGNHYPFSFMDLNLNIPKSMGNL